MPNELQQAYLDGASMAYKDVATKMRQMIADAPAELKGIISCMEPFAASVELKSSEVYKEAERIESAIRN